MRTIWVLVLLAVGMVLAFGINRMKNESMPLESPVEVSLEDDKPRVVENKPLGEALGVAEEDMIEIGGVKRPKRDIANASRHTLLTCKSR